MCRSAGIPARLAIGLSYDQQSAAFAFHVWNEVYVDRRWVAIDFFLKQLDVDATHIQLGTVGFMRSFEDVAGWLIRAVDKVSIKELEIH